MSEDLRKALEARELEIETRFWTIVDGDGLTGLPSDMWTSLETLVRRAALTSSQDGWLPIESAPQDDDVLGYAPGARAGKKITNVKMKDGKPFVVGGVFAFDHAPVTHWMPLPPPPVKEMGL